jgi:hypothetical protein
VKAFRLLATCFTLSLAPAWAVDVAIDGAVTHQAIDGFKHRQHLAFDATDPMPLCNLYVSMLQRPGIDVDRCGSSTGTVRGLEQV